MRKTITVLLKNEDGSCRDQEVDLQLIQDAGIICIPDASHNGYTESVTYGTFYRFGGLEGKFMSKPIFEECKMAVLL